VSDVLHKVRSRLLSKVPRSSDVIGTINSSGALLLTCLNVQLLVCVLVPRRTTILKSHFDKATCTRQQCAVVKVAVLCEQVHGEVFQAVPNSTATRKLTDCVTLNIFLNNVWMLQFILCFFISNVNSLYKIYQVMVYHVKTDVHATFNTDWK
jgi:hypothetical protein